MSVWETVKGYVASVGVGASIGIKSAVAAAKEHIKNVKTEAPNPPSITDVVSNVGKESAKKPAAKKPTKKK